MGYDERLSELAALPGDWDSYGADPISPLAIDSARRFLASASIVPLSSGGLQIEFGDEIEIEIDPEGQRRVFVEAALSVVATVAQPKDPAP